ncbi:E9 [Pygoscelis adeliae papillomavirus 2]|uniref:E9 n=1 Tax=Pygoscelis adeliae papillomavirus 2 TaxID=2045113 RepID=A0A291PWK3_9PAPI|nr:E9 [Pygoscelis adeliae papillomavirus 2]
MPTIYCPNFQTCWLVNPPDGVSTQGMTSVTITCRTESQSYQTCSLAIVLFLKKAGQGLHLNCIPPALPALRRRLLGRSYRGRLDARLEELADLGWRIEYLLKTQLPFNTATIMMPTENLLDLYSYLGPTPDEEAELRHQVHVMLLEAGMKRKQRHLRRGRLSGNSFFNAS